MNIPILTIFTILILVILCLNQKKYAVHKAKLRGKSERSEMLLQKLDHCLNTNNLDHKVPITNWHE